MNETFLILNLSSSHLQTTLQFLSSSHNERQFHSYMYVERGVEIVFIVIAFIDLLKKFRYEEEED